MMRPAASAAVFPRRDGITARRPPRPPGNVAAGGRPGYRPPPEAAAARPARNARGTARGTMFELARSASYISMTPRNASPRTHGRPVIRGVRARGGHAPSARPATASLPAPAGRP